MATIKSIEEKAKAYDEAIEDFADIQDYEGLYKINRKGEVLSVRSGKLLKAGKKQTRLYECRSVKKWRK